MTYLPLVFNYINLLLIYFKVLKHESVFLSISLGQLFLFLNERENLSVSEAFPQIHIISGNEVTVYSRRL